MTVVVDANLFVCLALDDHRAGLVAGKLREWSRDERELHAPSLFRFEVANGLSRSVAAGDLSLADAALAWERVLRFPIDLHELEDGARTIEIAQRLKRKSAYDAAYVALAEDLGTELWTLDGPLARNAAGTDLPVQLIETT